MTEEELLRYYDRYPSDRGRAVQKIVIERDALRAELARRKDSDDG